jgi:hypothetical protein
MQLRLQLLAVIASGALLFGVLELVRRHRFLERYAIFWLFAALVLLVLSIWKGLLGTVAHAFGIIYAPNALFVVAFGFVLLLLLHFSLAVSRLADQAKVMAQRLALLEERLRSHEQAAEAAEAEDDGEHEREPARFR